ncbi:leucine-rich repeat-containing protein 37A3-like isoform X2 [Hemicordylus capensis]|uniref:leucine-rich repeat-containing protein 37A3-like isoform X2 n=1 Tax=Hemicordylus capensis TaxID=884348 RepID=UPI0023030C02|nr:leucine-rich repeat-containing protein 37A3-like isoform X2 [Hemicordylus capensis]
MEVLKLWRVTSPSGLHRVPVPKAMSFLSFNGNSLSKLQEGSLSRTHRDLSSNKIQTIEMNSREAVLFVQLIDLSSNLIEKLTPGAFEARHGMQFLLKINLSSTEMTPKILEDLLQTSQQLKTLILPNKIFCCLCRMKDDIEVLSDTIKLDCTDTCTTNETLCEKDEALNRMQKEVMKALEIRKLNASSTLNIVPEKLLHSNITMKVTVRQRNTNLGELNPDLLKSVQELGKLKPEEVLQIKWNDTSELKKLYMLANLLQMALREQVTEDLISYILIILKHVSESSQQDCSLHEEETAAPSTTTTTTTTTSTTSPTSQSLLLEGTPSSSQNEPSEGNSEQTSENAPLMSKEALLNQLTRGTQEGGVPQIPGDNAEAPQIPGDDTEASHETHWEHHEVKTTARHKLNILPTDDDYLLQGDLFEAELNKRLSPLIPNTPVRNLISHTLRILKMDCTMSRVQLACAMLISRTGLLMKLFSERENFMDNSALWKSYFLSMKYVSNLATGSPRKLGKSEVRGKPCQA